MAPLRLRSLPAGQGRLAARARAGPVALAQRPVVAVPASPLPVLMVPLSVPATLRAAGLVRAPLPLRAPLSAASPPSLLVPLTAQQSSLWVVRITAQTAEVMALQRSVRGL